MRGRRSRLLDPGRELAVLVPLDSGDVVAVVGEAGHEGAGERLAGAGPEVVQPVPVAVGHVADVSGHRLGEVVPFDVALVVADLEGCRDPEQVAVWGAEVVAGVVSPGPVVEPGDSEAGGDEDSHAMTSCRAFSRCARRRSGFRVNRNTVVQNAPPSAFVSAWVRISAAMPGMPRPNATRGNVIESATAPRMFEPLERIIHR